MEIESSNRRIQTNDVIDIQINTWAIKRTLIVIACIDFFFNLLTSLLTDSSIFFFISIFILIGIYGLQQYKYWISMCYGIYLIFQIISRVVLLYYIKSSIVFAIFTYFIIIFDIWILWLLCKFVKNLKLLDDEQLYELRHGWDPSIHIVAYY